LRVIALVLLVTLAGCGGDRQAQPVPVPAVVGADLAAAECALAHARLGWRYAPRIPRRAPRSEEAACGGRYPAGDNVCSQRPRAGSAAAPGSVVTLGAVSTASRRQRRRCPPARAPLDDPRSAVLDVAFEYFRTAKVRAGRRTCKLLTQGERERLARRPEGCAATVNRELGPRLLAGKETVAVVISFDRTAGRATAGVLGMSIRGTPPVIELRRQRGAWRISGTGL
jgi:uncharacterized protein YceK